VSVGVATRRASDDNAAEVLLRADQAMYLAKSGGRNRVLANLHV
jgi:PleD family two-component response regulator